MKYQLLQEEDQQHDQLLVVTKQLKSTTGIINEELQAQNEFFNKKNPTFEEKCPGKEEEPRRRPFPPG